MSIQQTTGGGLCGDFFRASSARRSTDSSAAFERLSKHPPIRTSRPSGEGSILPSAMSTPTPVPSPARMPLRIFVFEMTYLVLLIALLIVYKTDHPFRAALPSLGPLPIQIAWFGATGGVIAGLGGVYLHNQNWNQGYDYWHYSRPLVAGITGSIGCLLFYVSLLLGGTSAVTPRVVTFDAVAFIFGFADKAFQEQVTKLTKLIIGPGSQEDGAAGSGGHSA